MNQPTPTSVSQAQIDALVFSLTFETARVPNTSTTVATARLPNGFVVAVGENHTVHMANYEPEEGRQRAIADAADKARKLLWMMEGYVLARDLYAASQEQPEVPQPAARSSLRPDQQRVIDEKRLLDSHIDETSSFLMSPDFYAMSSRDQGNMCRQFETMKLLSSIMADRIATF